MPNPDKIPNTGAYSFVAVPVDDAGTRVVAPPVNTPNNIFEEVYLLSNGKPQINVPEDSTLYGPPTGTLSGTEAMSWAIQNFAENPQSFMKTMFSQLGYQFDWDAWCADFVRLVLYETVGAENLPDWYTSVENKASCGSILQNARGHEVDLEHAQPGDIILFDWGEDGGVNHVGFFLDVTPDGTQIITFEGNTRLEATRNPEDAKNPPESSYCSIRIRDINGEIYGIYAITPRQDGETGFIYGDTEGGEGV